MTPQDQAGASRPSKLMASAFAGMFVFGIVMAVLGAILPSLFGKIGFSEAAAGDLFLTMNFAMLMATLAFGPMVDRFGFKALLVVCSFLVAAAFLLLTLAPTYGLVLAAAVVLGFGGGGLNGGTNALTSDINPANRGAALNLLGIYFGFGALTVPFMIGTLLRSLGLQAILVLATLLSLVPLVLFGLFKFPRAKQAQGFPLRQAAQVVGRPLLWLCGFLLFFESGNEFTAGGWISTYLQKTFHVSPSAAALVLAGYWAAIMAGRLASARFARALRGERLVLFSGVLAFSAAVLLAVSPSGGLAMAGAVLFGLGVSAIYPTTLAIVGESFPSFTGTAFSVVIAVGLAGGMISPWLVGRIAQASSLRHGLLVPVFSCAMIILLALFISRSLKKAGPPAA
ncbi:MAG: MFS transporter [Candidatus Aminicenantales bacterium]